MRYEHGPGHVRAGRLAAELRRAGRDGDPLIDGATLSLTGWDVNAEWFDRLADALASSSAEGADRAWAQVSCARRRETFPGVALRLPRRWRLVVGVAGTRPVNPARWLRRDFLAARARWLLEGRPPPVPVTPSGHDLEGWADPGSDPLGDVLAAAHAATVRKIGWYPDYVADVVDEQRGPDPTNRVRPLWPGWPGPDRGPAGG